MQVCNFYDYLYQLSVYSPQKKSGAEPSAGHVLSGFRDYLQVADCYDAVASSVKMERKR